MKYLFVLCVLCAYVVPAQSPSPTPEQFSESADVTIAVKPPKVNEKPATLDEIKQRAKANKTKGEMIFAYDKFKDESIIVSKPHNLVGSWEGVGAIMASGGYGRAGTPRLIFVAIETRFAGQTLKETPDKFALVFDGISPDWQWFRGDGRIYFLYDGDNRLQLDAMATDHDVKSHNRVEEKIGYIITREQAERIASATKVELRIGTSKPRELKPNVLKSWRAVLDATKLDAEK